MLKTTFPEELSLTARARAGAPLLLSAVAVGGAVRSEARYVVSGEPTITGGTGFVATLSLMARFGEAPGAVQVQWPCSWRPAVSGPVSSMLASQPLRSR